MRLVLPVLYFLSVHVWSRAHACRGNTRKSGKRLLLCSARGVAWRWPRAQRLPGWGLLRAGVRFLEQERDRNRRCRSGWDHCICLLEIMFVLVEMTDTVRIPPWQFERKLNDAITEELNKKLANKVVYNVGLCICLYDITKLEDSYIFPGDGASHTKVHFRYVVFHPFLDEILVGEIKGCSLEGVHVSLGFFDDIIIPPESLQQPAKFDEAEQVWVWEYETEEGAHDLYMDRGEEIRFRVVDEIFIDTSPTGPSSAEPSTSSATEEVQKKEAPYTIMGSISEPGLGLLSWWTNS